jgi:hypothetical protein
LDKPSKLNNLGLGLRERGKTYRDSFFLTFQSEIKERETKQKT